MRNRIQRFFRILSFLTFLFTFLVILAGSVVRVTQSGMGCPDWPKCFGYYIPPTSTEQVKFHPSFEYQKGMMVIENDTLWRATAPFVSSTEFNRQNWEKYPKHDYAEFIVYQTWIEYINRLLGAVMGLFVLGMMICSFSYWSTNKKLVGLSFTMLILTGFQGWLGALVVASNLAPLKITIHMVGAFLLLANVILVVHFLRKKKDEAPSENLKSLKVLTFLALILSFVQIMMGTQVREAIDIIAKAMYFEGRETWIEQLTVIFPIHRSFSVLVLAINVFLFYKLYKSLSDSALRYSFLVMAILIAEIIVGIVLAYLGMPAFAQPLHLLLASMLFAAQLMLFLNIPKTKPLS
jgi:cytochrome c oxidase assembly protein subunit 15